MVNLFKKSALALTFTFGLFIHSSNAATFNFTGDADFGDLAIANIFGVTDGTTGTFNATLEFDDTQLPADAITSIDLGFFATATYAFSSFDWFLGNKSWSYTTSDLLNSVVINDDSFLGNDGIRIGANDLKNISGATIFSSAVSSNHAGNNGFNGTPGSHINLFNLLTGGKNGEIVLNTGIFSPISIIELSNVSMSVSAVPLPAGVWLLGSAILGFVGIRRRRRLAA